ncbi:MAG: acetyl-CoA hydrolase/transferase C-terminal domain-containing protein, partial [Steroidobacteraceae bacterium]
MSQSPCLLDSVGECVEATLSRVGRHVVMLLPLALGKPNPLANEFFRRAAREPDIRLKIFTALSLRKPTWTSDLERRFLAPFVARVFGNYPELDYVTALRSGTLPKNVEVVEFFLEPGAYLGNATVQQHYLSANYTHVAREVIAHGANVLAQLVAKRTVGGEPRLSLSCNPDVTLDLLPHIAAQKKAGRPFVMLGEVNSHLPYMLGDAEVPADAFDYVVEHPSYDYDLYCPPNMALNTVDHLIGLNASALMRDGGTLQLGIGELGDAIVYSLQLRHQQREIYGRVLADTRALSRHGKEIAAIGGIEPFDRGVYGCSEMFVDGFLDLYRSGILKRRVYAHEAIQRGLNSGAITETIGAEYFDWLIANGVGPRLSEAEFKALEATGFFRDGVLWQNGGLNGPDGQCRADLGDLAVRAELLQSFCARKLRHGVVLHGGFFLGPRGFYAALRELPDSERRQFNMTSVGFINQLYGDDAVLRRLQRIDGRFINTAMMATCLGAAVSDGLADGRVVSGVGGQYNFVAMAHALEGARSILAVRATRTSQGKLTSNIVWNYPHTTIARHLRDVFITEYGIADLRGKTDAECVAAMLNVADSRFQESLLGAAKAAGKIAGNYRIPEEFKNNRPETLERVLEPYRRNGLFSP